MEKAKPITYEEFINLAKENYCKGGETYYECWAKTDFESYCEEFGEITKNDALRMFRLAKRTASEHPFVGY